MSRIASVGHPARASIGEFIVLAALELFATRFFATVPDLGNVAAIVGVGNALAQIAFLSIAIFAVIAWPRRAQIFAELNRVADDTRSVTAASASAILCLLALMVRAQLAQADAITGISLATAYAALIVAMVVTLILVAAPFPFWRTLAKSWRAEIGVAIGFAVFGLLAGEFLSSIVRDILNRVRGNFFFEGIWAELSDATLRLSYWILSLFEGDAFIDPSERILGAGNFSVRVYGPCSGYEGMILISAFLTGYVLLFRRSLKFPNVFVLFPLAMSAIWLLNSLRIALLVFIGANLSPAIALGGFHSQFGWISFLLVAITIMTSAQRIAFFATEPSGAPIGRVAPRPDKSTEWNPALLYLAPFVALLAGQILASAASPRDYLLYPIKVLAIGSVLYALRHAYARIWSPPALSSLLFGGIAGLIWIATDPGAGARMPLETSLSELTPIAFVAWLVFRAVGTVVMVPVAEELAFRGYLYRVMFSSRFETVDFRSFGFVALILSAGLFGLMHDRWLAASLAGLLYGLVMIRSGRISDAIAAHMTTNAVIFAWAVAAGQWSLL